jgi:thioredoxin reductase
MQGFLSRDGMPPLELLAAGRDEVAGYGVEILNDTVTQIEPGLVVGLASGVAISARRLLMTTGVTDDLPAIAGVRERWGRDLLHCPYCHGWEVRDQPLGVLGTHPGAVMHAQLVRQWSDESSSSRTRPSCPRKNGRSSMHAGFASSTAKSSGSSSRPTGLPG